MGIEAHATAAAPGRGPAETELVAVDTARKTLMDRRHNAKVDYMELARMMR